MSFDNFIHGIVDPTLWICCLVVLICSIAVSIKTKFVQFRKLGPMFKGIFSIWVEQGNQARGSSTIVARRALFTAMSTTLGMSTMVSPVIAMHFGGPGALLGFILTTIFGSAATYVEVTSAVQYRRLKEDGTIMGGPMQYLEKIFSPSIAKGYALCCMLLMTAWSGANANQLAAILSSPLLGEFHIHPVITGIVVASLALFLLFGGIQRIGRFSAKLVPFMFILYVSASLWIIACNIAQLPSLCKIVWDSAFSLGAFSSGSAVGTFFTAMRWGILKGLQSNEAGIGTQAIPHSMADTDSPSSQGVLAMASIYSSGFLVLLSGIVNLMTGTWCDTSLPLGISMIAESYSRYLSFGGLLIVAICTLLFGFGTILGNGYNGSECFKYVFKNQCIKIYYLLIAVMILWGAVTDVGIVWSLIDIVLAFVAVPNAIALLRLANSKEENAVAHSV